jgi:hypothetical protein
MSAASGSQTGRFNPMLKLGENDGKKRFWAIRPGVAIVSDVTDVTGVTPNASTKVEEP